MGRAEEACIHQRQWTAVRRERNPPFKRPGASCIRGYQGRQARQLAKTGE